MSASSKLHEPDLAGLLVPAEVTVDRLRDALAWLGISRAVIDRCTEVVISPTAIAFEMRVGDQWQRVAVESKVVRESGPTVSLKIRASVAGIEVTR